MVLTDIPNDERKRRLKAHNNYLTHNEKILLSERLHADYDITLKYAALQGYLAGSGNDKWKEIAIVQCADGIINERNNICVL